MDLPELTAEVEEVSAHYARRHAITRDDNWFLLKLGEEVGELTQAYLMRAGQARSKGRSPEQIDEAFRDELADVFAQVLLIARHFDVDLETEIRRKWSVWKPAVLGDGDRDGAGLGAGDSVGPGVGLGLGLDAG